MLKHIIRNKIQKHNVHVTMNINFEYLFISFYIQIMNSNP